MPPMTGLTSGQAGEGTVAPHGERWRLRVEGMDCADCALQLEQAVGQLPGVARCQVDFASARMTLDFDPARVDREAVVARVRGLGYDAAEERAMPMPPSRRRGAFDFLAFLLQRRQNMLTLLAGAGILLAVAASWSQATASLAPWLYSAAAVVGGYPIARKAIGVLRFNRTLDMNLLMTLAAAGALAIGEFAEGALVVFLFSLGEALEGYTADRARQSIRSLMALAPAEATALRPCLDCAGHRGQALPDGTIYTTGPCPWCEPHEQRVPVEKLEVGDRFLARPGERIAMDGRVVSGRSSVDQAAITGESMPVDKGPGDEVFAGSINGNGVLEIEVTRLVADNTLSRIIRMVEEAQGRRASVQRWVDRFARWYTPAVVVIAALVALAPPLLWGQPWQEAAGVGHGWLYRALALLVIACPCALVLSTPVTLVSALSAAARQGVLIKGGAHLEALGRVSAIAFDKTGTLTIGRPTLREIVCQAGDDHDATGACAECGRVLALAAAVERRSEHPLAQAVLSGAQARGVAGLYGGASEVNALAGRGVQGRVNGSIVTVGSHRYFDAEYPHQEALCQQIARSEAEGHTTMLVHDGQQVRGFLALADQARAEAAAVLAQLKQLGVRRTVMLTGDNAATARAIAASLGVDEVRAELLPQDKVAVVRELAARHGAVAMVGDGVNDAPALAAATVGVAMGGAGVDQALETADVVLMGDDLTKLPWAIRLSREALAIVRQNIVFSLGVKLAFALLALAGIASLWMAVFADVGASLLVIANGMRLLRRSA
jgi:Cd2+/Zn2+-exporting ATPase